MLNELCKIAQQSGNCRLVISYSGEEKFAVGISDGVTTPQIFNGTLPEIETEITEKLPAYLEIAAKESAERKAKEAALKHEAEIKAAEAKLKQAEAAKRAAEKRAAEANKADQPEFSLF